MPIGHRLLVVCAVLGATLALNISLARADKPADAPDPDPVILVGTYSCSALYYAVLDEPPVAFLNHRISFSGTGLLTPPAQAGPGFGRRSPVPGSRLPRGVPATPDILANLLGLSASVELGEGTLEECISVAQSIAGAATAHGCVASPVRSNATPYLSTGATFTIICEASAAEQLRTIGDLSRAIITAELP